MLTAAAVVAATIAAVVAAMTAATAFLTAFAAHWPSATSFARLRTSPLDALVRNGLVGAVDGVQQRDQRTGARVRLGPRRRARR